MSKKLEKIFADKLTKFSFYLEICISYTYSPEDSDRMIDTDIGVAIMNENDSINLVSKDFLHEFHNYPIIKVLSDTQLRWLDRKLIENGWELAMQEFQYVSYETPHYVDSQKLYKHFADFLKFYSELVEDSDLTPVFDHIK